MSKLTELKAASALMLAEIAEIEKLEAQPKSIWQPKDGDTYYYPDNTGHVDSYQCENDDIDSRMLRYHNAYQTEMQAEKAAFLTRRPNRIIQACINFDPDFLPDWTDGSHKCSVAYHHQGKRWVVWEDMYYSSMVAYVSSEEIAQSICDLFNEEDERIRTQLFQSCVQN